MGNTSASTMEDEECFICFKEINRSQYLLHCNVCKHICHRTCYRKWWEKKRVAIKRCLYCQQAKVLELRRPWYLACFELERKIY